MTRTGLKYDAAGFLKPDELLLAAVAELVKDHSPLTVLDALIAEVQRRGNTAGVCRGDFDSLAKWMLEASSRAKVLYMRDEHRSEA